LSAVAWSISAIRRVRRLSGAIARGDCGGDKVWKESVLPNRPMGASQKSAIRSMNRSQPR
jgi:hypothetical protein